MKPATAIRAVYDELLTDVALVIEDARRTAARSVNTVMTMTYGLIGRRIVEQEQQGAERAEYGERLLQRLAQDLSSRFGRGFSKRNLEQMRAFYLSWPIAQTLSAQFLPSPGSGSKPETPIARTPSAQSLNAATAAAAFPLPWSHYTRLLAIKNAQARAFYETEALRGGWTIRQLARQIQSQFYEWTALSRDKAAMLRTGGQPQAGDAVTPDDEIKNPYVLEFLALKDEYSETELEGAMIEKLQAFLLELGGDVTFVGRQRRCAWAASSIGSTCCFFTAGCAASS